MPGEWAKCGQGALLRTRRCARFWPLATLVLIVDKRAELVRAEHREDDLHREFAASRATAAGLANLRARDAEASAALAEMIERLPLETEVPGLVEDITRAAVDNDLAIDRIDLADERQAGFYRELPMAIGVVGDYHDLGAFADVIAGLPRLVTMHDFDLAPRSGPRNLSLTIEARTYRYAPADARSDGAGRQRARIHHGFRRMTMRVTANLLAAAVIAGCGSHGPPDVPVSVAGAEPSASDATAIPTDETTGVFRYGAMAERNPFEPDADLQGARSSSAPDPSRRRHPQERFPLGQLEMVGHARPVAARPSR